MVSGLRGSRCKIAPHKCPFHQACCAIVKLLPCRAKRKADAPFSSLRKTGSICPCWEKSCSKRAARCAAPSPAISRNDCVLSCQHRGCPGIQGNAAHHSPSSASSQRNQRGLECCIIIEVYGRWVVRFRFNCDKATHAC